MKTEPINVPINVETTLTVPPPPKVPIGASTKLAIAYAVLSFVGAVLVFAQNPSSQEAGGGIAAVLSAAGVLYKLVDSRGKQAETLAAIQASTPAPIPIQWSPVPPDTSDEPDEGPDLNEFGVEASESLPLDAEDHDSLPTPDVGEGVSSTDRDLSETQRQKEVDAARADQGDQS